MFLIVTVPVYIPTNTVGEVPFLHNLSRILYIFLMIAILTGVRQYFIAFAFCIFIIISNTTSFHLLFNHPHVFFGEISIFD